MGCSDVRLSRRALLPLAAALALAAGCRAQPDAPVVPLRAAYTELDAPPPAAPCDAWPGVVAASPPGRAGRDRLWLCGELPTAASLGHPRAPALAFPPGAQALRVEVNGRVVHEPHVLGDRGVTAGLGTVWIPLDVADLGRPVRIRADSLHPLQIGLFGAMRVGEHADLVTDVLRRDAPAAVLGLLLVLVGLVALGAFRPTGERRLGVAFGASALSLGVYSLHYTQLRDLVTDAHRAWTVAWLVAVAVAPVAILSVLVDGLDLPRRHALARLRGAQGLVGAVYVLLACALYPALQHLSRATTSTALRMVTVVDVVVRVGIGATALGILAFAVSRLRAGDRNIRWVAWGLIPPCLVSGLDVFRALTGTAREWGSTVPYGYFPLVVGLAGLLRDRYVTVRARAERQARELDRRREERAQLLRDLHDGVGSLVGNIRQLAQLAERGGERGQRAALRVEQIAAEAVLELRDVTAAVSPHAEDWSLLRATLRRTGAQLVEAHDRGYTFVDEVEADAPAPSPELALHLRRFLREAVHNALKHTRSGAVSVTLEATKRGVALEVRDEGGDGPSTPAPSSGLGLESLARRARALGGELDVELDRERGSRVTLRLPPPGDAWE